MRLGRVLGVLAVVEALGVSPARAAPRLPAPNVVVLPGPPDPSDLLVPFDFLREAERREVEQIKAAGPFAASLMQGAATVLMGAFALRLAGVESPSPRPEANDVASAVGFSIASALGGAAIASAIGPHAPADLRVVFAIGPGGGGVVVSGRF